MHFFDLMQFMFVNGTCPGKSWKKDFRVLENPGIWSLLVLESPGKKHFNVCTNHVNYVFKVWLTALLQCKFTAKFVSERTFKVSSTLGKSSAEEIGSLFNSQYTVKPFKSLRLHMLTYFGAYYFGTFYIGKFKPHSSNTTYYTNYSWCSIDIRTL